MAIRSKVAKMRGVRILVILLVLFPCSAQAQSWAVQTSGIHTNLRGVSVVRPEPSRDSVTVIWASGSNGIILRSTDSGRTWNRLRVPSGDALDFRGIQGFDEKTAYVMSSGEADKSRIYKTIDGGANWQLQFTGKRESFFLDALVCDSAIRCFALSDPVDGKFLLLVTQDGQHWAELPSDSMPLAVPGEGAFAASGTCLAVAGDELYFATGGPVARVFHSTDSGRTWTFSQAPLASGSAASGIFSIVVRGNNVQIVGGDYQSPENRDGVAAHSEDRGISWESAVQQPGGYRSAIAWVDSESLIAAGPSGVDISLNGGVYWEHLNSLNLNALSLTPGSSSEAWAVGPKGTIVRFTGLGLSR